MVIKALNKASVNGRKVSVEVAGENNGKSDKGGRKRGKSTADAEERPARGGRKKAATEEPAKKKTKPSREERGYTEARGPKKKDDWMKFFQHDDRPLRGEKPDFGEDGWAKKSKKRKK